MAALRLKPQYAPTHRNLGFAYQSSGRLDEAILQYRELIRLKPDHPEGYNNLAMILATANDAKLRTPAEVSTLSGSGHFSRASSSITTGSIIRSQIH